MPRKPGGKYKGKIGRSKGEATIAAELEAKRRKAYEANLARLQQRRQQELLAEAGLQSAEEEAQALKLAKIAQMFGHGKAGTLRKFWKNWQIGIIAMRKEKALDERKTCWRRSCGFCASLPVKEVNRHGLHNHAHTCSCKAWWKTNLGREDWGEELDPVAAASVRPDIVNEYRMCQCCGADTGMTCLGCRCWHGLLDAEFVCPSEALKMSQATRPVESYMQSMGVAALKASASSPALRSPRTQILKKSEMNNWARLRESMAQHGRPPEYDPSEPFHLSPEQAEIEARRAWSRELATMAGSPTNKRRAAAAGDVRLPMLSASAASLAPQTSERGEPLQQVTHWRTGQKTMLDKHLMKMYVVGVQ